LPAAPKNPCVNARPDPGLVSLPSSSGSDTDIVFGIYGRGGMPRDIVNRLNHEIVRAMQTPEAAATLAGLAAELVAGTAEEFAARQRSDRDRYGVVVREAGIRLE